MFASLDRPDPTRNSRRAIQAWEKENAARVKNAERLRKADHVREQIGERSASRYESGASFTGENIRGHFSQSQPIAQPKPSQPEKPTLPTLSPREVLANQRDAFVAYHEAPTDNRIQELTAYARVIGVIPANGGFVDKAEVEKTLDRLNDPFFKSKFGVE